MKWLFVVAMMLASGLSNVRAADAAKERSIDELTLTAEVAHDGDFLAYGFDALWMMTGPTVLGLASIVRVDGKTSAVDDISVPETTGRVRGLAIGEGAVWIPDAVSEQIFKFDPVENKIVLVIPASFSGTEGSVGVGAGSVWVTTRGNVLSRFSAATGALEASISLPGGAPAAIFDNGLVWVTGLARDELYKIDPRTNTLVQTIALRSSPRFLTAGEGSIWVLNQGDGTVQRIDPLSGAVIATIETGHPGRGGDIAAGDGYVWASLRDVPLVQIDPKANTVAALLKGTGWGDAVRFGGGSLWISGRSIRRLTPPIHKSFCELRGRQGPARGPAPVDSQSRWADAAATPDVSSLGKCSASPSDRSAHSCGANGLPRRHSGRLVCDVDRRLLLGLRCGIRCMGEGGVEALGDGLVVSPVCAIAPKPQAAPNYMI